MGLIHFVNQVCGHDMNPHSLWVKMHVHWKSESDGFFSGESRNSIIHAEIIVIPLNRKLFMWENQWLTEKPIIWSNDGQRGGDIGKYEVMTIEPVIKSWSFIFSYYVQVCSNIWFKFQVGTLFMKGYHCFSSFNWNQWCTLWVLYFQMCLPYFLVNTSLQ